jgi:transposase
MLYARIIRHLGASVNEDLLQRQAILEAQVRELMRQIKKPLRFELAFKMEMARLARALSKVSLQEVALVVRPSTVIRWYKQFIAGKWDGSKNRKRPGRPRIKPETERLIIEMAQRGHSWGAKRIQGALQHVGIKIAHQTVLNVLRRHGVNPVPKGGRQMTWSQFIAAHYDMLVATDFFTVEVIGPKGLTTLFALFFIDIKTRLIYFAGLTEHPNEAWMMQVARTMTMDGEPFLLGKKVLLHDGDGKYCKGFRRIFKQAGVNPLKLPPFSPNLNAFAERWIRSIKSECLQYFCPVSKASIEYAIKQYVAHYNAERTHQGLDNQVLSPQDAPKNTDGPIKVSHRLAGLLPYYYREAQASQ